MRVSRREMFALAGLPALLPLMRIAPAAAGHVSFASGAGWWDARGEAEPCAFPSRPAAMPCGEAVLDWYAGLA